MDFIDEENNRRIEIHKRRKVECIMPSVFKKEAVYIPASNRNSSARLVTLVEKIFLPDQSRNDGEYVPLTSRIVTIDEDELMWNNYPYRMFK